MLCLLVLEVVPMKLQTRGQTRYTNTAITIPEALTLSFAWICAPVLMSKSSIWIFPQPAAVSNGGVPCCKKWSIETFKCAKEKTPVVSLLFLWKQNDKTHKPVTDNTCLQAQIQNGLHLQKQFNLNKAWVDIKPLMQTHSWIPPSN